MRSLRAELILGTAGMTKGVADAKKHLQSLQSQLRLQGKDVALLAGFDSVRAGAVGVKKAYSEVLAAQGSLTSKRNTLLAPILEANAAVEALRARRASLAASALLVLPKGKSQLADAIRKEITAINREISGWNKKREAAVAGNIPDQLKAEEAAVESARAKYKQLLDVVSNLRKTQMATTEAGKQAAFRDRYTLEAALASGRALPWQPMRPPVIQSGLAGIWQRMQAQGGGQNLITQLGFMFGGGRGSMLGGAIGGLLPMGALMGSIIGAGIALAIAGFKRLFTFIANGLRDVFDYARGLQNFKSQTGLSYSAGAVINRAAEMAGLDPHAVGLWFSRLQANLTNIHKITPEVSAALFRLGLPLVELRKMEPDQMLDAVLNSLSGIENKADQAGVAMALFNRQGAEMMRLLLHLRVAAQQIGMQRGILNAEAWKDSTGRAVKFADVFAFIGNSIGSATTKLRGFFVGIGERLAVPLTQMADAFNRMDFARIGEAVGTMLKPMITDLAAIVTYLSRILEMYNKLGAKRDEFLKNHPLVAKAGGFVTDHFSATDLAGLGLILKIQSAGPKLFNFVDAFRKTRAEESFFERLKKAWNATFKDVPSVKDQKGGTGIGALSSFFGPFGKGPGDQYSKVGAFMSPGVQAGFATGIQGWQDKVVTLLDDIKQNTKPPTGSSNWLTSIWDKIKGVWSAFVAGMKKKWDQVVDGLGSAWSTMIAVGKDVFSKMGDLWHKLIEAIKNKFKINWSDNKRFASPIGSPEFKYAKIPGFDVSQFGLQPPPVQRGEGFSTIESLLRGIRANTKDIAPEITVNTSNPFNANLSLATPY